MEGEGLEEELTEVDKLGVALTLGVALSLGVGLIDGVCDDVAVSD